MIEVCSSRRDNGLCSLVVSCRISFSVLEDVPRFPFIVELLRLHMIALTLRRECDIDEALEPVIDRPPQIGQRSYRFVISLLFISRLYFIKTKPLERILI